MKNLIQEFKAFIDKGDVVTIAVGLVMALAFKTIIDSIITGVIDPIIAAIVGKPNLFDFGFDLGDARVSVGSVVNAAIYFVAVSAVLFVIVKAYNRWRGPQGDAGPTEVELLTQIRDELRSRPGV